MTRERTILVTGAYGLVGRELVRLLVEKTDARVIATGRKIERLASLAADLDPGRVATQALDVLDPRLHERGSFLLTGAGLVPGLSAILALRGAEQLPVVDSVEIVYAQARMPATPNSALS